MCNSTIVHKTGIEANFTDPKKLTCVELEVSAPVPSERIGKEQQASLKNSLAGGKEGRRG